MTRMLGGGRHTSVEDEPGQPGRGRNYARRALWVVICFSPVALLLLSLGVGLVCPRVSWAGIGLVAVGWLVTGCNLYVTSVRPVLYARRHGSTEGMQNVSPLPLLGTLLVTAGGVVGFADWRSVIAGLAALALDLGGLPWLLIATWRDRSMWDD